MHRQICESFARRLGTKEAAAFIGFSESTLRQWRCGEKIWHDGLGPKFFSINGRIYYFEDSLEEWLSAHIDKSWPE